MTTSIQQLLGGRAGGPAAPRATATGVGNGSSPYEGATDTRYRKTHAFARAFSRDEDRELGPYNREKIRLEIRHMRRNLGIVFGALSRFANGVVGSGVTPQPTTSDPIWNRYMQRWWSQYMRTCDSRGRLNGREVQRLVVKARMSDGESAIVLTTDGKIQPIEAELIQTPRDVQARNDPNVIDGFRLTRDGRPMGLYVCPRGPTGLVDKSRYTYVKWDDVFVPSVVERFSQVRATPGLSCVINTLRDLGEYQAAALFRAKLDAFMGWAIYSDSADSTAENMGERDGDGDLVKTDKDVVKVQHEMGEFWHMPENAQIKSLAAEHPSSQYEPYTLSLMREVSMALDIPWQVLMLEVEKSSFSGGQGIFALAENTWGIWRGWLVDDFLQPWWEWRVGMAIATGEVPPAPVENGVSQWDRVDWIPPAPAIISDSIQASTDKTRLETGSTSPTRILRRAGTTEDEVYAEKAQAIRKAIGFADEINKAVPGAGVHWRDIASWGTPGAVPASTAPAAAGTEGGKV